MRQLKDAPHTSKKAPFTCHNSSLFASHTKAFSDPSTVPKPTVTKPRQGRILEIPQIPRIPNLHPNHSQSDVKRHNATDNQHSVGIYTKLEGQRVMRQVPHAPSNQMHQATSHSVLHGPIYNGAIVCSLPGSA